VIPNLTMDLIVPLLARVMNVYLAGQVFIVGMFALIISGGLALNRALIGRWSVFPLFAFPILYNYLFLVGLMNYIFGIGVALWALAGWVTLRERSWPIRFILSSICVVALFFCHLCALGIYGVGLLSFESSRLWERRANPGRGAIVDFVAGGYTVPRRRSAALCQPDDGSCFQHLLGSARQDRRADVCHQDYSDIAAFALVTVLVARSSGRSATTFCVFMPWSCRCSSSVPWCISRLPRIMFDTYMTDQRVRSASPSSCSRAAIWNCAGGWCGAPSWSC